MPLSVPFLTAPILQQNFNLLEILGIIILPMLFFILLIIRQKRRNQQLRKMKEELELFKERYEQVSDQSGTFMWEVDRNGMHTYVDPAVEKVLGYTPSEMIGKRTFYDDLLPEDKEELKIYGFQMLEQGKKMKNREVRQRHKEGHTVYTLTSGLPIYDGKGNIIGYRATDTDITSRKKIELSLKESEEKYRLLFENALEGIAVLQQGKIKISNPMLRNILKTNKGELKEKNLFDFIYHEDRARVEKIHRDRVKGFKDRITEEFRVVRKDGAIRWIESKGIQIIWNGAQASLNFLADITERKETEKNILHLSYHDQLTGIYNRRFFEEELHRLDNPRNLPLSIVIVDVNGLKLFNDGFGHKAGDRLIVTVAQLLDKESRGNDVAARIGGDEFVVLMPNTDENQAKAFEKRFQEVLAKKNVSEIPISVSLGFATKVDDSMKIQDIFKRAEEGMYRRKMDQSPRYKKETLDRIMQVVFDRIHWEESHAKNTEALARVFGQVMGYSQKEIENLALAGYYHDIGKIGVDQEILKKKTLLDLEELKFMERHPEVGYQLLNTTNETFAIAEIVLYHDEKWDGSGYPQGLKGEEIPKGARIISLVEVFDNLMHDRPYQPALSFEEAEALIESEKGKAFEPQLVEVFLNQVLPHIYENTQKEKPETF